MNNKGLKGYLDILKENFYTSSKLGKIPMPICYSKLLSSRSMLQTNSNIDKLFDQMLISKFLNNNLCYNRL